MAKNEKELRTEIINEAIRIEEDAIHSAKSQFEAADTWKRVNLGLGIPAAILSGVAGYSILTELSYLLGGILALIVAALTSLMTFLNPNQKSNTHLNSGNNYLALRNKSRIFRNLIIKTEENTKELFKQLQELSTERDRLNKNSPQFSWANFRRARAGIKSGQANYRVD